MSRSLPLKDARRIVVKVGSSLVTNEGRGVDADAIGNWCRQLATLASEGRELVMVSSGAIVEGMKRLGWTTRPKALHELQAAAAVGQMGLAQMYETKLREQGMGSAQVLLTHADLADRERYLNARFIDEAIAGTPELELMAGGVGTAHGRGGMITKILAAKRAAASGASTVIAWGREPDVLLRLAAGEAIGTALLASTPKLAARKLWMVDHLQMRGAVTVDAGAAAKVQGEGKSLLPIGVIDVQGDFQRGDVIAVRDPQGRELARGLSNYSSSEARLIARKPSVEIERLLGYAAEPELIHRDNLVLR